MRESLDRQLNSLKNEILLIDSMVEQAVLNSVDSLKRRDLRLARRVVEDDHNINDKRYAVENAILTLIATQQPIAAGDLRLVTSMLDVISELERIGDYAKGIAHVTEHVADSTLVFPIKEITRMCDLSVSMLHRAMSAFINANEAQARRIPLEDAEVNDLYHMAYHQLLKGMTRSPEMIDSSNQIMWVLHNLERMADRVSNICERTIFIVTGELIEIDGEVEHRETV
ncbi:MAG: phosphate signaling complex protein PhoU [Anaerolineae bacterium]|nr:phosphate signaling complex protein PhoU [Anaerolineae bacterium]